MKDIYNFCASKIAAIADHSRLVMERTSNLPPNPMESLVRELQNRMIDGVSPSVDLVISGSTMMVTSFDGGEIKIKTLSD